MLDASSMPISKRFGRNGERRGPTPFSFIAYLLGLALSAIEEAFGEEAGPFALDFDDTGFYPILCSVDLPNYRILLWNMGYPHVWEVGHVERMCPLCSSWNERYPISSDSSYEIKGVRCCATCYYGETERKFEENEASYILRRGGYYDDMGL
jgi:hypothetical protein